MLRSPVNPIHLQMEKPENALISNMSFCRRRRPHLSSITLNPIEVEGQTMLCFPTDHSSFTGSINIDDDESAYSLIGELIEESENDEGNNNKGEGNTTDLPLYKVTLTDHFTGTMYQLPNVRVNYDPKAPVLITPCSNEAQITFEVEHVYRGQKADMVLQHYGGTSSLVGQKCRVYMGPIRILFNETESTGRNWCL